MHALLRRCTRGTVRIPVPGGRFRINYDVMWDLLLFAFSERCFHCSTIMHLARQMTG